MNSIRAFFQIKRNIYITVGVVALLFILMVIAIASSGTPPAGPQTLNSQPVTLTWWKPFYGTDVYKEIIDGFNELPGNENVTINLVNKEYGNDYYRTLIADIARGAGPDIFTIRNDDLPAYKEFMTPLDIYSGDLLAGYKTDFVDLVVKDTIDKDKVYAISSYVDNLQLYYNKNIISQAGIALPPRTWSELDRQIPFLNKRNQNTSNFDQSTISLGTGGRGPVGSPNINRHQDILPMLLFQSGGQMFDAQTNRVIFGSKANEQDISTGNITDSSLDGVSEDTPTFRSIKFYTDFANLSSSRYSWNTSSAQNIDAFAEGDLAYMLHYSYMDDILRDRNARLQFDVAPLPQLDPEIKKTYGFFFMDGMNRTLETNPDNALKRQAAENFLYYLSQPEAQNIFVNKTRLPGSRRDVIADQVKGDDQIRIFAQGALYADNYYKPDVEKSEQIWSDMIERIQFEGQPLKESIDEAITEYDLVVKNGPKLR